MSKIEILVNDGLIDFMKSKESDVVKLQSPTRDEYRYKIYNLTANDITAMQAFNNTIVEHDEIVFNKDNAVVVDHMNNYNSIAYSKIVTLENISEANVKLIYELFGQSRLFEKSAFTIPDSYEWLSLSEGNIFSLHPKLTDKNLSYYKSQFPSVVDFLFTNESENKILNLLHSNGLYQGVIDAIGRTTFKSETRTTSAGDVDFRIFSLHDIVNDINQSPSDYHQQPLYDAESVRPQEYTALEKAFMTESLKDMASTYCLTPSQIMNSESHIHKEILCYRVEKYRLDENSIYQTFYIPADEGYNGFVDTQIFFGKTYRYRVSAIMAVFVPTYEQGVSVTGTTADIMIRKRNEIKLYDVDMININIRVTADAPPRPTVLFLNESNNEKRMRFYFEPSHHEEAEVFIPIESADLEAQLYAEDDKSVLEKKIVFRPNPDFLTYEIYKLNQKPKSYQDFRGSLYADVSNNTPANSEVFETFLTPNRKFYFMFRSKNGYGLYSNPTAVYEVELVHDSDETKVVVNTIKMEKIKTRRTKSFGRFIRIYPSFEQTIVREHKDQLDGAPLVNSMIGGNLVVQGDDELPETFLFDNKQFFLGVAEGSIWGRKFKIRVKSNNTGKIVDLNVDFILKKKLSAKDFS